MASACAVLGPPPASVRIAPAPAQPGPASFTPSSWLGSLDRQGLSPMTLTASGTVADDWAGLMPENDADEDEADGLVSGEKIAPILAMEAVSYDVPQADDPRVRMWVDYLSGRGRESFGRWLARSTRYVPVFWPILEQYDLPKDLVFLSMVESGFSPRAYSWAHASGAWQFMPATGRRFGLRNGFWVDERRDFVKATHAAAKYLSALYDRFGHWYLAFAAYNAGPGRVSKAIRRTRTKNFWRISRTRRLKRETKHYVPKILAAARVAKQPEAYGFGDLEYLPPLRWDNLHLDEATDLKTVAQACGLESPEPLQVLNPELRARVTPPGVTYPLRVPVDTVDKCQKGLAAMSPKERYTYRYHDVRPSDDLKRIARLYSTTATAIANFNEIASGRLDQFDELVVPVKLVDAGKAPIVKPTIGRFRPAAYGPASSQVIVHRVRSGDSLWRIARRYRVSIRKLRLWNGLWRTNTLRVGQRLRIHGGRGRVPGRRQARRIVRNAKRHRVRAGESLWSIAARHGTSIDRLCRLNGMKRS
ncbi:MAG: LysM peptidoglycan-binding domain-containing protein, partial [Myxococcota bacterium]